MNKENFILKIMINWRRIKTLFVLKKKLIILYFSFSIYYERTMWNDRLFFRYWMWTVRCAQIYIRKCTHVRVSEAELSSTTKGNWYKEWHFCHTNHQSRSDLHTIHISKEWHRQRLVKKKFLLIKLQTKTYKIKK